MMKMIFKSILILLTFSFSVQAALLESITFDSKLMKKEMKYSIYLPEGYDTSSRAYPITYLLHGMGGDNTEWSQFAEIERVLDGKRFRAIVGESMGGYGALYHAMKYPDLYSTSYALSAGIRTDEQVKALSVDGYNSRYGKPFGMDLESDARLNEYFKQHDLIDLVSKLPKESLNSVRFFIDCGDDDFFTEGNALLHVELLRNSINHEYRVRNGGHEWSYWRTGIEDALIYISDSYRGNT